ncbi:MAG: hypothetical protein NTV07_07600 [Candidatus Omnitrophica bacterium]|nr:hypothetical protein [Candidatus Omnitrophota bacterium]
METKKDFYKAIRIAGLVSYIPFALAVSPIAGYFVGDYINERFFPNKYTTSVFAAIGLLAGLAETFRIIKLLVKLEKR